ncbi:hypothetical protein Bca4012_052003 [Brassica carinata]
METVMSLIRLSLLSYRSTAVLNRHGAPHLLSSNTPYLIFNLELILLDIKGRVRVWHDYHGEVSVAKAESFFSKLSGLGNILRQQHVASLWLLSKMVCALCKSGWLLDKLIKGLMLLGQSFSLYPGRSELPFLHANRQVVILQPLGDKGITLIGGNTIRCFTSSDQAYVGLHFFN